MYSGVVAASLRAAGVGAWRRRWRSVDRERRRRTRRAVRRGEPAVDRELALAFVANAQGLIRIFRRKRVLALDGILFVLLVTLGLGYSAGRERVAVLAAAIVLPVFGIVWQLLLWWADRRLERARRANERTPA